MIADFNSLADIEFRMTRKSDAATHSDNYTALRANFWWDCFPQPIFKKLLLIGWGKGESQPETRCMQ
jgi:hypothetical protein